MTTHRLQVKYWLIGLAMFGVLIAMSFWRGDASLYSIIDHQTAGSANVVDIIQSDWRASGLRNIMIVSMIGDFIFIGFYGWGSFLAGRSFLRVAMGGAGGAVRALGGLAMLAAIIFLITDYVETICQFIQMVQDMGSDPLAATAAFMQPIKSTAFIITFLGILSGLVLSRFSGRDA